MEVVMKICTKCKIEKDESEFYRKTPTRLYSWCKACNNVRTSAWKKENTDSTSKTFKKYYYSHREKQHERNREYRANHKVQIMARASKYYKNRRREDALFAVKGRVSRRITGFLRSVFGVSKSTVTHKVLGCTGTELLAHLGISSMEELEGMHLDHQCPLSCANTEEEVYKLNHYSNLRIIPAAENLAKSDNWTEAGAMLHLILLGREWPDPSIKELDNSTVV
jgi:5-methylcytosine-specific restriction endonuclease McrA